RSRRTVAAGGRPAGMVVLTKDRQMRSNQIEIVALINAGVPCFNLSAADMTGDEMAIAFVAALPRMRRFLQKFAAPFIATITRSGAVSMLFTHSALIKRVR